MPGDPPRTWTFKDGALLRGIGEDGPVQTDVTELAAARLRILSAEGTWSASWPPEMDASPPRAVELGATTDRNEEAVRLFDMAGRG